MPDMKAEAEGLGLFAWLPTFLRSPQIYHYLLHFYRD